LCEKLITSYHKPTHTEKTVLNNDTIEFNVDSKAEYSALSSTRSQKKKLKQTTPVIREVSPEGIRVTMEERPYSHDINGHALTHTPS